MANPSGSSANPERYHAITTHGPHPWPATRGRPCGPLAEAPRDRSRTRPIGHRSRTRAELQKLPKARCIPKRAAQRIFDAARAQSRVRRAAIARPMLRSRKDATRRARVAAALRCVPPWPGKTRMDGGRLGWTKLEWRPCKRCGGRSYATDAKMMTLSESNVEVDSLVGYPSQISDSDFRLGYLGRISGFDIRIKSRPGKPCLRRPAAGRPAEGRPAGGGAK